MFTQIFKKLDHRLYFPTALLLGFIALTLSIIRQDLLWSLISIVYIVLMTGVATVSHEINKKWDLVKFSSLPLLLGASGITGIFDNYILFLTIVPMIAFIIILNLMHRTTFRADYNFKGNLIAAFTLSTGTLLGIGRFLSDMYLGTMFLGNNVYLMIDLFFFTVFGIAGGVSFKDYLMHIDYSKLDRLRFQLQDVSEMRKKEFLEGIAPASDSKLDRKLLVSQVLQLGILILIIQSLLMKDYRIAALSIPALGFTMAPYVYTWNMEGRIPSFFHLVISASLFFYLMGTATLFYTHIPLTYFWWNRLIHFIGGMVVAFLIYIYLFYRNRVSEELYIPTWMIPLVVLAFLLSVGVLWELFEFFFDVLIGTDLQSNASDTIYDMILNVFGAFLSITLTHLYYIAIAHRALPVQPPDSLDSSR